ncbi:glucan phosphoethanolaminetransferase (alkaline phosphatase superfamily) [Microbacterium endophyticum]|uniref:Glucan phosphoethanolaminetransferase (Alkaline phosphatase superfamily) n=1 Tax=Microbacterium endophyticum TaxID=1526412 RepID=A0A7W4V0M6_9MICO|nr:bacitracin resistance protein [Microbacterium endophyticum]MBB2974691.1 glucan phosphoethanolaminetransferase (alkaline phosphatase superfamily) [Microbacterium endophyticum]NIK36988.1 glucan phosphoethanolaminetransferase (alkaline phosphatase superfamily) [Microbacterium endophyticum]
MMASTTGTSAARRSALPTWLIATVSGLFGLFYAYAVWNAVDLLIRQASGPLGLSGYGWFVLLAAVFFPILAFAGALTLGWRRKIGPLVLILLTGLALVSVFWLNIVAYASVYGTSLLGS